MCTARLRRSALSSPLARSRAATESSPMRPYHVADRRLGTVGILRRGIVAESRRRVRRARRRRRHAGDAADAVGSGALRRRARPPQDQVDQQTIREDRRGRALPVLRQRRGRRARQRRRTGRALRRGDLRGRRAVRPAVEHPRRRPAGQRRRGRFRRLVQRAPALRGDVARPVRAPGPSSSATATSRSTSRAS